MAHNEALKKVLEQVKHAVATAKNDTALVSAIHLLNQFPKPVSFNNRKLNIISAGISVLCLVVASVFYFMQQPAEYFVTSLFALLLTGIVYLVIRLRRKNSLTELSAQIYYKSTLFDYGLKAIPVQPQVKAQELGGRFKAFQHGNYKREIKRWLEGKHAGSDHTFLYNHYHFHYVDQRTETYTTTDSEGRTTTRTRTVYDHYDRYGFVVNFEFTESLRITESTFQFFQGSYKSSSISFNKKFNVDALNEHSAAKFLTPVIINEIEAAGGTLQSMDLEFNPAGELCFSFTDSNTIMGNSEFDLTQPEKFAQEIEGHQNQPKLQAALDFIHTLMKYSDNNFEEYK